ncbi:hypothetical protein JTE90_014493 [Oedothorax gibbosus]|uniref:Eclosion hormone n=1 Tax=Oedothorax gibbosus TaxID=931172 RepID=A0AAV6VL19_9ARAC|nr:hypothetical protein JTE90_014493 [Oedothorax gibbosus]
MTVTLWTVLACLLCCTVAYSTGYTDSEWTSKFDAAESSAFDDADWDPAEPIILRRRWVPDLSITQPRDVLRNRLLLQQLMREKQEYNQRTIIELFIMKTCYLIISLLLFFSASECVLSASTRTCIINCGQCKKMYGDYFLGQRCAEECIKTGGYLVPDCNEPSSIMRYLSKLA